MRRLVWIPILLAMACTPLQQEVAREKVMSWASCSGIRAGASLVGRAIDALKEGLHPEEGAALRDWKGELSKIGLGLAPGVLECATAEAVRFLRSQHKAASTVAMEPQSDKTVAASRGEEWLRKHGWRGDL